MAEKTELTDPVEASADPAAPVMVRVLVDVWRNGRLYPCGSAAEFPVSVAAELVAGGMADDNRDAVAYALQEGQA